jgi:hypothetical protein
LNRLITFLSGKINALHIHVGKLNNEPCQNCSKKMGGGYEGDDGEDESD